MIFSFHTHCFPDKLAPKALSALSQHAAKFDVHPHTDCTVAGTEAYLKKAGIDGALVCNIATNAHQEHNVNDFAINTALSSGFFYAAGSVHPESENIDSELDRLKAAGIKGIKIHPDYVRVDINDEKFDRIFCALEARDMFVVTHAGLDPISPDHVHCSAKMLKEVKTRHKGLKLIAAHMGSAYCADEVLRLLAGTDIMMDTSLSSLRVKERDTLLEIMRRHDDELLLFGTDTPWTDASEEIRFIEGSGLPENSIEKIFYGNAAKLLK